MLELLQGLATTLAQLARMREFLEQKQSMAEVEGSQLHSMGSYYIISFRGIMGPKRGSNKAQNVANNLGVCS